MFIAILTDENRPHEERGALRDLVDAVDRGQAIMVTSTLIQAEVLDAIENPAVSDHFRSLLNLPNVLQESVTPGIAQRAGKIRLALRRGEISLKTVDAVFVATALAHNCVSLQTYDRKLLKLSGRPEVSELIITKPGAAQMTLAL